MSDWFQLDERLKADTIPLGDLGLSSVLLMNDTRFRWLILVPRVAGAVELVDLHEDDALELVREARIASAALRATGPCDKLNVATLGNAVPQLHLHVVARTHGDAAWPRPVFGAGTAVPHSPDALAVRVAALRAALEL